MDLLNVLRRWGFDHRVNKSLILVDAAFVAVIFQDCSSIGRPSDGFMIYSSFIMALFNTLVFMRILLHLPPWTPTTAAADKPHRFFGNQFPVTGRTSQLQGNQLQRSSHNTILAPVNTSQWKKQKCIGSGSSSSSGKVYHASNKSGQLCAIKEVQVISNDTRSKEHLKQLNQEKLHVAVRKPALQHLHGIPTDSAASFDLQERFSGVQTKNSSEAGENCSPSFDLSSVPSSPSLIPCSQWEKRPECIGCGGFGKVYLGVNSEHGQLCAIKEVPVISNDPRSEEQVRQLHQEICLLKQWSHPNIVQYYDSIMTDTTLSIYMEHVSKGSIDKLLAKIGSFKESLIRSYTAQILTGLAFLHEKGHIHRDIKGASILVGPNDVVKIADFGLTKHIATLTAVHTSCRGTPWWMAPEVILSTYSCEGYNVSADIWSLGCTVIEMATGNPPLHGYGKMKGEISWRCACNVTQNLAPLQLN